MSDKGNEKKDIKLKKPTEVSVEVGYVNEEKIHNCSEYTVYKTEIGNYSGNYTTSYTHNNNSYELKLENFKICAEYTENAAFLNMYTISNMRNELTSGKSVHEIYDNMKNYILANKDTNPDNVQRALAQLLGSSQDLYDNCVRRTGLNIFAAKEGYHRENLGNNGEEILDRVLAVPEGEELHGFVCSTISEFGMHLLEECGIKSALLCGGSKEGNHTILLWQREDGKYAYTNYGKTGTIDATNIKDAAKEIYKRGIGLHNNGYMYMVDEDGSYQEYSMKEEAVWGNELDKRDYNSQNLFSYKIADKPGMEAKVQVSGIGGISAEAKGTLAYGNDTTSKETSISLGYKKNNGTSLADNSSSIGAKVEHLGETITANGKKFFGTKVIVDYTTLNTNQSLVSHNYLPTVKSKKIENEEQIEQLREFFTNIYRENFPANEEEFLQYMINNMTFNGVLYNDITDEKAKEEADKYISEHLLDLMSGYTTEEDFVNNNLKQITEPSSFESNGTYSLPMNSSKHLTTFIKTYLGKEKVLLNDGNIRLSNAYQAEGILGLNISTSTIGNFGGDLRITGQEGLKLDVAGKQSLFSTNISGGIVADFALKEGTLTPTVSPGIKLNGATSYQTRLNDNVSLGAGADGYAVVTKPSVDYGASTYVQATYKPNSSNITIFGGMNYGIEKQNIRIGGFNEQTENITTLGVAIGAQIGRNTRVSLNYNNLNNKLNATKSREVVSISAKVNL